MLPAQFMLDLIKGVVKVGVVVSLKPSLKSNSIHIYLLCMIKVIVRCCSCILW